MMAGWGGRVSLVSQADLANKDRWVVGRNEAEAKAKAAQVLGVDEDKVLHYFQYSCCITPKNTIFCVKCVDVTCIDAH